MKIAVCVRHNNDLHKICWLNESQAGIYCGIFTDDLDTHLSYHTDGRRHTKIGSSYHQKHRSTPLRDFTGATQISHQAISLPKENDHTWPKHSIFKTWESTIVLDDTQFQQSEWLAFDIWLFETSAFKRLDRRIKEYVTEDPNFRVLTSSYHQLSSFPNLNLGLVFRAAKSAATDA